MTAPNEIPGAESPPQGTDIQSGTASPEGTPTEQDLSGNGSIDGPPDSGPGDPSEGNYEKRMKDWQAKHTRLSQEVKPLKPLLEKHGGQQVAAFMDLLGRVAADPTLGPLLTQFDQTGRVELPRQNSGDETVADEEDYERPWLKDLNEIKGEILEAVRTTSQGLEQLQTRSGEDSVARATKRFLGKYPELNSDELGVIQEKFDDRIQKLGQTPQGRQVLLNMGDDDMESLMAPIMSPLYDGIYERRNNQKSQERTERATDAPGVLGTTGREARSEEGEKPKSWTQIQSAARRGAREIFKEAGWNPDRPL